MAYLVTKKVRQSESSWLSRVVVCQCMVVLLLCGSLYSEAQNYFRTEKGDTYIQSLTVSPAPTSGGAMYVNSTDKKLYWYNGNEWLTFASVIPITGPDGTAIVHITSPSGRIWMDRDLGASRAATSIDDYKAMGSLFEWCRAADGHQRVNWTSYNVGTPVYAVTSTQSTSTTAPNSLFIGSGLAMDWLRYQQSDGSLWWNGTVAGANNPCPNGYHVPTSTEWQAEINAGVTNSNSAYTYLRMVYGLVNRGGLSATIRVISDNEHSSSNGGDPAYSMANVLVINTSTATILNTFRSSGIFVRCIRNQ